MRRFLDDNPRLAISGALGILVFLALFGPAFMGSVRPQPLARDEIVRVALDFAAAEGWGSPSRLAVALPVEGDDLAAARAAGGDPGVDRETLPDPAWEVEIVTNPRSVPAGLTSWTLPDPILSVALTPAGEVVQYLETSSPVAGLPAESFRSQRLPPMPELKTDQIFDTLPEDRREATDEELAAAASVARGFFERHRIELPGAPTSTVVVEGWKRSHVVHLEWSGEGPHGTEDLARVIVWEGRVAAYDRDLRVPGTPTPEQPLVVALQLLDALPMLVMLIGGALVAALVVVRRRFGEVDARAAGGVFVAYLALSLTLSISWMAVIMALGAGAAGTINVWLALGSNLVTLPFVSVLFGLILAGAWAAGEGQAYLVWPRHLIRPFSAALRGNFRTPETAPQVATGYLLAFAALGAVALLGLLAPPSPVQSIAPLFGLSTWPIWLSLPVQATGVALSTSVLAGIFAMTFVRSRTRRLWVVLLTGTLVVASVRSSFNAQQFFPAAAWAAAAVGLALAFAVAVAFVRYGPLAQAVAVFVFILTVTAYPLVLSPNGGHAASGAWALALGLAPAALAAYGVWRPQEHRAAASVPAHVRRALDRLRISEEFDVARKVQAQLLPAEAPHVAGLDVAGVCVPANEVGGDYYDYFDLGEGRLGVAIGDVSGKGVGAAIYMTLTKSYMVTQARRALDPMHVLSRVNAHLRRNLARGNFVTMAYAVADAGARRLDYTRAGHNPPLLVRANGEGDFLNAPGLALGAAGKQTFEAATRVESVDLEPGDLLLLYTDGVTEAMNGSGDEYGEERLIALTRRLATSVAPSAAAIEAILQDVRGFAGRAAQHDDITIVAVRVR